MTTAGIELFLMQGSALDPDALLKEAMRLILDGTDCGCYETTQQAVKALCRAWDALRECGDEDEYTPPTLVKDAAQAYRLYSRAYSNFNPEDPDVDDVYFPDGCPETGLPVGFYAKLGRLQGHRDRVQCAAMREYFLRKAKSC